MNCLCLKVELDPDVGSCMHKLWCVRVLKTTSAFKIICDLDLW